MNDILKRLKEATGSDRELDAAIFWKLFPGSKPNLHTAMNIPDYTSSIDAALALVEKMLPGSGYMITRGRATFYEPMFGVELYHMDLVPDDGEPVPYDWPSESNSLPLAILCALFTALEAKG